MGHDIDMRIGLLKSCNFLSKTEFQILVLILQKGHLLQIGPTYFLHLSSQLPAFSFVLLQLSS